VPPGTTITIRPGTLRSSGQHGTVRARLSGGTAVTLGLYSVQGHWRLYGAQAGAQASAKVTGPPVSARLMADVTSAGRSAAEAGTYQGVIEVHGFGENASYWDSSGMTGVIKKIPGVQVTKFDYSRVSTQWVNNKAIGPALADYIHAVAKDSGRPVIVVGFSMGGLAIRYAATTARGPATSPWPSPSGPRTRAASWGTPTMCSAASARSAWPSR
jgi:pimeloyl-ACP methyl ester carboxylesterase